ncbi:MAG: hypothetical protein IKQ54_00915 [Oscillospiraceae bacterium]|nr:hypothetical protein [Oscillospiraceae bacterium]
MYRQDWLMRQIETITRYVFSLLLGKGAELRSDYHLETKQPEPGDANTLSFRLGALLEAGRVGEAENLLFAAVEEGDPEALPAGLGFYEALNGMSDEALGRADFSREEILSGLKELCAAYGYDTGVLGL